MIPSRRALGAGSVRSSGERYDAGTGESVRRADHLRRSLWFATASGLVLISAGGWPAWAGRAGGSNPSSLKMISLQSSTGMDSWWHTPWSGTLAGALAAASVAGALQLRARRKQQRAVAKDHALATGETAPQSAICDLHGLVDDAVAIARMRASRGDLLWTVIPSEAAVQYINADAAKLRQALADMLGHAAQCKAGQEVTLRWYTLPYAGSARLRLRIDVDAGDAVQGDDARLAIARERVRNLGGTIQIDVGRTLLRAEFPVQRAVPPEQERVPCSEVVGLEPGQPEYRVLVVGDEPEPGALLQHTLQSAGFRVRLANSCSDAVDTFPAWRPHFICVTAPAQGVEGLEATRRIRSLEMGTEVRIAGVTPETSPGIRTAALAAGMDDVIRWPCRPGDLFQCLARHLPVRYVYRTEEIPAAGESQPLRLDALALIPEPHRVELADAVMSLDAARIQAAARHVGELDSELGHALAVCAARYEYTEIFHALQSAVRR